MGHLWYNKDTPKGGNGMTLAQIQYFLTAARCLSFTTAAKELYMSQPALGRQVSAMEDELGVRLFVRSKSALQLTPVGSMLRDEFNALMTQYHGILQKVHAMGTENSVLIRIGILEGYGLGDILPRFLNSCCKELPQLMVDLVPMSYGQMKQELIDGKLDFALTFQHDVENMPDVSYRVLMDIPVYLAYHRNMVEQKKDGELEFRMGQWLYAVDSPEDSSGDFAMSMSFCEKLDIQPRYKMVDGVNAQLFYVRNGYCCGFLAGNSNLRCDPAIVFEKKTELEQFHFVAAWNIRTTNPAIHICVRLLKELMEQSEEPGCW